MEATNERQAGSAGPLTNGITTITKEDSPKDINKDESKINGHPPISTVDHPQDLMVKMKELPPELQQVTEGYAPLSRLFERVAHDTHNTLQELLLGLESTDENGASQVNGNFAHHNRHSGLSDRKKLKLLEWAETTRDRFMKLFVMLKWAQTSRESVGKLIDLRDWMLKGVFADQAVQESLMWIVKNASAMRLKNPDIENALRLLLDGDASRMSDLDYLPRNTLSAKELLAELDRINIILHIRLNLHHDLPKHLQDFSIASGRVTFKSPGSFEMDLSILDEDRTSRFYFIDFRFLFSPASEIPTSQLRFEIEFRLNTILASEGLTACFDFLHDYVLTYKLSVLRRQAMELARSSWIGHLRVERFARSLILHYWIQQRAKKSWIEIGVWSGRNAGAQMEQPRLNVKWMRYGKPIEDCLQLDEEDLNIEFFMNSLVQEHIQGLLDVAAKKLPSIVPQAVHSAIRLEQEADGDFCLQVPIFTRKETQFRIGAVTGEFAATPMDATVARIVEDLNGQRDPIDEFVKILLDYRLQDAKSGVTRGLGSRGWHFISHKNLDATTRRHIFGDSQASPLFARRWQNPNWVLAACADGCFDIGFWLIELKPYPTASKEMDGFQMRTSQRLGIEGKVFSNSWLTNIQETTTFTISAITITRRLQNLNMSFSSSSKTLRIRLPPKYPNTTISPEFILTQRNFAVPSSQFATEKSTLDSSSGQVLHVATFKLFAPSQISALQMMSASKSSIMTISRTGEISILVTSPIGSVFVVDHVLRSIDELLRAFGDLIGPLAEMQIREASTERVVFDYGQILEPLTAVVDYSKPGKTSLSFRPRTNPHRRIQHLLESALRTSTASTPSSNLGSLPESLLVSLPLLQALDAIESQKDSPAIHASDLGRYTIVYRRPVCRIKIQFLPRNKQAWWYIQHEQARTSPQDRTGVSSATAVINEQLQHAMKKMYSMPSTEDVNRLRNAMFVKPSAMTDLLHKLDEQIRLHANDEPELPQALKIEPRPQEMKALKPPPVQASAPHRPPQITEQHSQLPNEHLHPQQQHPPPQRPLSNALQRPPPRSQPMTQSRSQGQIPQTNQLRPTSQPMSLSRSQGQDPLHLQPQAPGSRPASRNGTNTPNPNANARGPQFSPQLPHQMRGQGQARAQLPQGTNPNDMLRGQQIQKPQIPKPQIPKPKVMMYGLDYYMVPEHLRHMHPNDFSALQQRTFFGSSDMNLGPLKKRTYDDFGNIQNGPGNTQDGQRKAPKINGVNAANGAAGGRQYQNQHQNQHQNQNQHRGQNHNTKGMGAKDEKIVIDLD